MYFDFIVKHMNSANVANITFHHRLIQLDISPPENGASTIRSPRQDLGVDPCNIFAEKS